MDQVLNQTSVWWFSNTKHITENAIVSVPDPNVTIAKKCTVFPVEFVGKNNCFSPLPQFSPSAHPRGIVENLATQCLTAFDGITIGRV